MQITAGEAFAKRWWPAAKRWLPAVKWKLPAVKWQFDIKPLYRAVIHGATIKFYRPRYSGFENIPETGPAILISNHVSYVDGPILDAGCKRKVRYLIDEDIYNLPVVHYIMSLARAIPIA